MLLLALACRTKDLLPDSNGVDSDCAPQAWYLDGDGDGFGGDTTLEACEAPSQYVAETGDCDDALDAVYPGAPEEDCADPVDYNCDGVVGYADEDGDGFAACEECDDTNPDVNPGADEVCNGIDDNCDGVTDDDAIDAVNWYADVDQDQHGDSDDVVVACEQPEGYVTTGEDCDDTDEAVHPDAVEEVGDEVDQDCDGGEVCLADADDDGFSDSTSTVASADADCQDPGEAAAIEPDGDCDDGDPAIHPDAVEVCDDADNDCDGDTDESDAWWDASYPYRVPVTLTGASTDVDGPPVLLDVDFAGHLTTLGDSGAFDADSLRVVVQDCSLSQPELVSQFLDEVVSLPTDADHDDPSGDGHGTVAFLYDEDGDTSSLETLVAGAEIEVALYFDTSGTAPGYATTLAASTTEVSNDHTAFTLSASHGGLLDALTFSGTQMSSQTDSCCGNGSKISSWSNTPMYVSGTTTVVESGPVLALVESTSSMTGYDATYWYWLFDGRPEVYSKTYQVATGATSISHSGGFGYGVRPWESRQDAISSGATFTTDSADYLTADINNGSLGLTFSWVSPPAYTLYLSNYDPYLIVDGNSLSSSTDETYTLASGDVIMDHPSWLLLPYSGAANAEADTVTGLAEGVGTAQGDPESY